MQSPAKLFNKFCTPGRNRHLNLSLFFVEHLKTHLKDHTEYDQGPEIHDKPRRVLLLVGEAQPAGCLKVWVSDPLEWDAGIQ